MFERQKYKQFARIQLKDRIGLPVLITFITIAIVAVCNIPTYLSAGKNFDYEELMDFADIQTFFMAYTKFYSKLARNDFLTTIVTMVETVLTFGAINMYLKMSRSPAPVSFSDFTDGLAEFGRAILAYLWQLLWLTLWFMLFIIPGIIKSYEYSMIYYIASEYKKVSIIDAMNISKIITRGHKWDLFIMDLSFLGWIFLGCISLGIGFLWIIPYITMTEINAYHALLKEAIEDGRLDPSVLKYEQENDSSEDAAENNTDEETETAADTDTDVVAAIESETETEFESKSASDTSETTEQTTPTSENPVIILGEPEKKDEDISNENKTEENE